MTWFVGWNQPGCLPDHPPHALDTWEEAFEFLRTELGAAFLARADAYAGDLIIDPEGKTLLEEYVAVSLMLRHATRNHPYTVAYQGQVWWVADFPD